MELEIRGWWVFRRTLKWGQLMSPHEGVWLRTEGGQHRALRSRNISGPAEERKWAKAQEAEARAAIRGPAGVC